MYRETPPTIDRPELDPAFRSPWPTDQPFRSEDGWIQLCQSLGHVALEARLRRTNNGTFRRPYLRGGDRLSADDIRELESYFEFLRRHYGIPEGATVFPKRDAEPAAPPDPEDDDAA